MHDKPLTMEQYLASPTIVEPFRKEDCCLISDGGARLPDDDARTGARPRAAGRRGGGRRARQLGTPARTGRSSPTFTSTPQVFAAPGRVRDGGHRARRRRRVHLLRPVHDPHAHADRGQRASATRATAGEFVRGRRARTSTRASCRRTPTAGCCRTRTCSASPTWSRSCASCAARRPRRCPDAEIGVYGGYTGPQAATLVCGRASRGHAEPTSRCPTRRGSRRREFWAGAARGRAAHPPLRLVRAAALVPERKCRRLSGRRRSPGTTHERRGHPVLVGRRDPRLPPPVRRPRAVRARARRARRGPGGAHPDPRWSTATPPTLDFDMPVQVVFRPL